MSGLVIHRSRHAQEYVVVPNSAARDQRISFTARGLHHYLLSLPPEWTFTVDQLASWNPGGRKVLRAAMKELRHYRYVLLVVDRGQRGRFGSHYEVFDTPPPDATRPASGPTCDDSVFPQVAPDATRPAATRPASIKKYGNARGGAHAAPRPPRVTDRCRRCGGGGHEASECPA